MEIEKRGSVVVIHLKKSHTKNKLTARTMQQFMHAFDKAESCEDATCVVTIGMGKFYSTGLDIDPEDPLNYDLHQIAHDMRLLHTLLARVLTFSLPTIAAISGHAFGGGAFLALAHDYRIMCGERGWWCVPAATVGIRLSLPNGLTSLLRAKVPVETQSQVVLARRFTAEEARAAGIIHEVCPVADLTERALAAATKLAGGSGPRQLHSKTLATIKRHLYSDTYSALSSELSYSLHKSKL